jgi:hypothetical protein
MMTSPSEKKTSTPAKTFKRIGRPKGSKNKPKKVILNSTQIAIAEKLGVPKEEFAEEIVKLNRRTKTSAQSKVMKDRWEQSRKLISDNLQLMDDNSVLLSQVTNLEHQIIGFRAVISYLEAQLGLKRSQ